MNAGALAKPLATLLDWVLSSLTPPRCRFCRAPLFDNDNPYLCATCVSGIPWIGDGACRGCGYPAGPFATLADGCHRCRGRRLNLTAAAAVARYHAAARELVLCLKFRGETEIARPMAELLAARLASADFPKIDVALPVALHPARRRSRGFDQSALLVQHLSRLTGLASGIDLVERVRHTTPQATLRREARLINMDGAFRASPALSGAAVLLVDDVMTTGATMSACARACREAGARRVYGLVFAR